MRKYILLLFLLPFFALSEPVHDGHLKSTAIGECGSFGRTTVSGCLDFAERELRSLYGNFTYLDVHSRTIEYVGILYNAKRYNLNVTVKGGYSSPTDYTRNRIVFFYLDKNVNMCDTPSGECEAPPPPPSCDDPELPDDPDLPNPDPDVPNEPDETANNLLENIHATLDSFRTNSALDDGKDQRWQQHMLGQVRALLKKLEDGIKVKGGGGGGGSEAGMAALGDKLGDKLDEIKCELAEDCEGEEGEEKEKPSAKVDCEKSIFECKGDIIQCALLKVQYEDTCPVEQLAELKDKMNKLFVTDRTGELVDKDTIDFSKIDSKYLSNGVSFGNANCPASESVTINHFAGSTSVEISYEPACHYARIAAPIHVILAWVAGLLLIGRTQGAF